MMCPLTMSALRCRMSLSWAMDWTIRRSIATCLLSVSLGQASQRRKRTGQKLGHRGQPKRKAPGNFCFPTSCFRHSLSVLPYLASPSAFRLTASVTWSGQSMPQATLIVKAVGVRLSGDRGIVSQKNRGDTQKLSLFWGLFAQVSRGYARYFWRLYCPGLSSLPTLNALASTSPSA